MLLKFPQTDCHKLWFTPLITWPCTTVCFPMLNEQWAFGTLNRVQIMINCVTLCMYKLFFFSVLSVSGVSTVCPLCVSLQVKAPPCWCIRSQGELQTGPLTLSLTLTHSKLRSDATDLMQNTHLNVFFTLSPGFITVCLFSLWQAGEAKQLRPQNVRIALKHPSSITVQTRPQSRCFSGAWRHVSNIYGGLFIYSFFFLTAPPESPGQASFFLWTKTSWTRVSAHIM